MDAEDKANFECAAKRGNKGLQQNTPDNDGILTGSPAQVLERMMRSR